MTRLDAASHDYFPRGWIPIPIPLRAKKPGFKKWQEYQPQNGQLERDFRGDGNVGVLLGKPSGWLIDVDLDWPEAGALASDFLPETEMKSGRASAPLSHWWFISESAKTQKWIDPNKTEGDDRAMIVELRSTGAQTVVAPSVHPSGETYVWHGPFNPTKIDRAILRNAVARLAASALISRYWPSGARHGATLALAGALFRCGWSCAEVCTFILYAAAEAGDDEIEDRGRAIKDTEKKFKAGEAITGFPTLVEIFGAKTVNGLTKWLDLRTPAQQKTTGKRQTTTETGPQPSDEQDLTAGGIADLDILDGEVTLKFKKAGRGKVSVEAYAKDELLHHNEINFARDEQRTKFLKKVAKRVDRSDEDIEAAETALLQKKNEIEEAFREEQRSHTKKFIDPADVYNPYEIQDGKLIWSKPIAGSGELDGLTQPITLTNFTAEITGDVIRDDGTEPLQVFEVEVKILGEPAAHKGAVKASEFSAMRWPVAVGGARAVIYAGKIEHTRAAVQLLSDNIKVRRVVAHTGWRKEEGVWRFYHAGGAIGAKGAISADVELPPELAPCDLPIPPTGARLREVVREVAFELPKVAPERISLPLIGAVFVAVLTGGDFSLFLLGTTGKGKTELLILAQSFFGKGFDEKHLPAHWGSTALAIQETAHLAKDIGCGVDDFVPKGTQIEQAKLHAKAETVLRGQANGSGRARCKPDGSLRPERPPRGLIISTGEDIPRGQSLIARLLAIEVKAGDVDWEQMTLCQEKRRTGVYAEALSAFLRWLATDNRIERLQKEATDKIHQLRAAWLVSGAEVHKKVATTLARLQRAWDVWLKFAEECGAIDSDESTRIYGAIVNALDAAGRKQARFLANENPAARFIELLKAALSSGKAHIASTTNGAPDAPTIWGWRDTEVPTIAGPRTEWRPLGDRIGWAEDDSIYLQPDAAYKMAQSMGVNGEGLTLSSQALWKRLKEERLLSSTDEKRETNKVRKTINGELESVIHMSAKNFFPDETP